MRHYDGNKPEHAIPLARFGFSCAHCGQVEFWSLYRLSLNHTWDNLKLVAEQRVCAKANYWLTARRSKALSVGQKRIVESTRHRDAAVLRLHRSDLYKNIVTWLER